MTTMKRPRKADFRQRAHCNPLADSYIAYPPSPDYVDWSTLYPKYFGEGNDLNAKLPVNTYEHPATYTERQGPDRNGEAGKYRVNTLDVGCGFGGMIFALAENYPDELVLGMEIREKVTNFVGEKIAALRAEDPTGTAYQNAAVVRTNTMKFLPNYVRKDQLSRIFFNFPDPHFKRTNWRRRIVTPQLLTMYAYHLKDGGRLYFVTDVEVLFNWMVKAADRHPLFERVPQHEAVTDFGFKAMQEVTEEGKKVTNTSSDAWTTDPSPSTIIGDQMR